MKYCTKCIMPDTRPNVYLNENGVCGACISYDERKEVDWDGRKQELLTLLKKYRSTDGSYWDCIVPVSGGKDSTYQVLRMLELGMNPLCVTGTTCHLTEIGRKNIENLKGLGVDYLEFTPNTAVRKKLNRVGLIQLGDISWPEHAGIFTIPLRVAVQYKIPLIIWGENGKNEYGGLATDCENNIFTRKYLEKFALTLGLNVADAAGIDKIEKKHLIPYTYPTDQELKQVGVTAIFLGYFIPWDGYANALISQANGMTTFSNVIEGSFVNYENLDNYQTGIHDYFMYLKYGFGRATDMACLHIRRGRLDRTDAIKLVRGCEGMFPWTYLGKPLEEILKPLDISLNEFIEICDRFTNKNLFLTDSCGVLLKDKQGNLIKKVYPESSIIKTKTQLHGYACNP